MTRVFRCLLRFSRQLIVVACWLCTVDGFGQTANHIDFNPDNGRSDVRTPQAFNWPVGTCSEMEQTVGNIRVRIKAAGPSSSGLTFCWWKAGYDFGATLCSDGITTEATGDGIEMTLAGFSAGKHKLVTWHNVCDQQPVAAPFRIQIFNRTAAGDMEQSGELMVNPSHRVTHDDDGKTCSMEFDAKAGSDVVFRILPTLRNQSVVINCLAWDIPNPAQQATRHWPVDQDEHVPVNPELTWQATPEQREPDGVVTVRKYHVFFGTDRDRVLASTQSDAAYLGATASTRFSVPANDCLLNYYWRVDCEHADGTITPGRLRRFRTQQLAFPGAEGYGRFAIGGRGGRVLEVTNLDDSGPGSLRAAVESDGPRTVVFRVGGTIKLQSKLLIRNPYITIAGQTAPGDGICVRGYTFGCFGTHDVIMRFVRIRVGDESHETMDGTGFASTDHSIFDHCSISWSIDEAVSSRSARNITLQRCIVSEALNVADHRKYQAGKGHSFAASISGNIGSFHHNLLAHCAGRNWSLAGGLNNGGQFAGRLDIRNNVVFNWEHRTNDGGVKALNLVNNLYIPGPATRVFHLLKPDVGSPEDRQQYFVSGNSMEGRFGPVDNWRTAVITAPENLDAIRLDQPFCESHVTTCSAEELLENVLDDVGANHSGLDCVDQRIIQNVRRRDTTFKGSRTGLPGIIDSQADVGGWPVLKTGTAPPDTDHDGMADAWEIRRGLDPNDQDQNNPGHNKDGSGAFATMLEEYLAELCGRP
jgi:hypothetical protein